MPENFCVFPPNQRATDLGVVSCVLAHKVHEVQLCAMFTFAVRGGERVNIRTNARENVWNICDYLTGKYAGPFAGIITVAYLKLCENIYRFSDVFWMQGDLLIDILTQQNFCKSRREEEMLECSICLN